MTYFYKQVKLMIVLESSIQAQLMQKTKDQIQISV